MEKAKQMYVCGGIECYAKQDLLRVITYTDVYGNERQQWIKEALAPIKQGIGNAQEHFCSLVLNSRPMYLRCEPTDNSIHRTSILSATHTPDNSWFDEAQPIERRYNHLCPIVAYGIVAFLLYFCQVDSKGRIRGIEVAYKRYKQMTYDAALQAEKANPDSDLSYYIETRQYAEAEAEAEKFISKFSEEETAYINHAEKKGYAPIKFIEAAQGFIKWFANNQDNVLPMPQHWQDKSADEYGTDGLAKYVTKSDLARVHQVYDNLSWGSNPRCNEAHQAKRDVWNVLEPILCNSKIGFTREDVQKEFPKLGGIAHYNEYTKIPFSQISGKTRTR